MAFIIKDRVKEGTTTTGTGALTLGGSSATFDPFNSFMTNGDTTYYAVVHTSSGVDEWEVGLGTWNTGNTFTRTTVLGGSNGTSAVDFSGGTKDIFMTYPAAAAATLDLDSNDLAALVTLGNHDTGDLTEGSNLYYTDARVDAHLSGGTGVTYSSGAISIGQAVGTGDAVTFNGVTSDLTGNADTATALQTARTIAGQSFDGTANITIAATDLSDTDQALATTSNVTFNNIAATGTVTLSADPSAALGAATKQYVDTIAAAGIHYHTPVRVETPSNLNATYDNGSSGVGATLTNAGTQAAITIDGVALSSADRVLVYNQTNAAHNGIYTVTTVGDGSTNWVLTRATDADSYGVSDPDAFGEGDAFFVKEGATGAGELYVMNTSGTITFGTTNITFTVIAETAVYSAGDSLTITGTTFDTIQDIRTTATPTFAGVTAPLTGNASTATTLQTARTIGGVSFDGSANINLAGVNTAGNQDTSGNAATATALETARTIGGVSFDGTANITLPGVNSAGNQDTSGNAATATALATARNIALAGDVTGNANFDGTGNISITAAVQDDSHNHVISNVDGLQTALDGKTTTARTISAGSGLTGGGDLTSNRTISHADTSTQASLTALTGAAVVSDIDVDTYGHVTGLATRNLTLANLGYTGETNATADQTITAGSGLSGGGTGNVTLSHADTSSQASVDNSGTTVIQDVTLDTYGHVTGLASKAMTLADLGYTGATNANYITNNNQLTNGAGYTTNVGDITGVTAGSGITGGGTSGTVTINHADTSSQTSVNNSGRTYIQDITLDTYGHITGITSATETVVNTDTNTNQLTTFQVEDGDGNEVTISQGKEWKFTEAGGININWTDTDNGSDTDPYDLSFNISTSITAGGGLTGGGALSSNRTISHADTSSQASVDNSGATVIQDVTLDGYGHVTALGSHTLTLANLGYTGATNANYITNNNQLTNGAGYTTNVGDITGVTAGSGISGGGTSGTVTISHADTSSQASVNGSGRTYIQDITLDTYGHVTGIATATETVVNTDTNTTYSAGTNLSLSGTTFNVSSNPSFTDVYVDDQIFSTGDTNTYMQFHAADQWRVVVGGSERLEVKNSSPHVLVSGDLNSTSDIRLKDDIKPIENALSDVCKLEGVSFNWKDTGTKATGFIAQQVEPILPDLVSTSEDDGIKSVNYIGLIGHLVEAIKEQQVQIDELKAKLNS